MDEPILLAPAEFARLVRIEIAARAILARHVDVRLGDDQVRINRDAFLDLRRALQPSDD